MDKHDDIVARLRSTGGLDARLLCDAAAEIERLRAVVEAWLQYSQRAERDIETLRDEIERLRKELRAWQDAHRAHPDEFGGNPE